MERRPRRLHMAPPQAVSPGRTKVWVEPRRRHSPPTPPSAGASPTAARKVPVVYYLCRNRHLEHPHFMEVPVSSPDGLFLKDVIERLNALRGKGMARMYSWSCKRSYKNGFVWHDLTEDDLVLPARGNEYVLKGSELLDRSPPPQMVIDSLASFGSSGMIESIKNSKQESPGSVETQPDSSSPSTPTLSSPSAMIVKKVKNQPVLPLLQSPHSMIIREDEQCHTPQSGSSENFSPEEIRRNNCLSGMSSPSLSDCRILCRHGAQDAATQTEDVKNVGTHNEKNMCTADIPAADDASDGEFQEKHESSDSEITCKESEIVQNSPPPTSSSASTGGRLETLESLIRAEASKRSSLRMLGNDDMFAPINVRMKVSNLLMQLITCGSLSVKDHHGFDFVPAYRARFTQVGNPPSAFSTPRQQHDLEHLPGNTRSIGMRLEDDKFSGSLLETKNQNEDLVREVSSLKHSTAYSEEERVSNTSQSKGDAESLADTASIRCLPQTMKIISCKQSRSAVALSPNSEMRAPLCRSGYSGPLSVASSNGTSRRIIESSSTRGSSLRTESFHGEKMIRIEERLASGARVIIQSTPISEGSDSSVDSL